MYPKVGLVNKKPMLKDFLNNSKIILKKARNGLFWPLNWPKLASHGVKIGPKISIFGDIDRSLELKIYPKVGLLRL